MEGLGGGATGGKVRTLKVRTGCGLPALLELGHFSEVRSQEMKRAMFVNVEG